MSGGSYGFGRGKVRRYGEGGGDCDKIGNGENLRRDGGLHNVGLGDGGRRVVGDCGGVGESGRYQKTRVHRGVGDGARCHRQRGEEDAGGEGGGRGNLHRLDGGEEAGGDEVVGAGDEVGRKEVSLVHCRS